MVFVLRTHLNAFITDGSSLLDRLIEGRFCPSVLVVLFVHFSGSTKVVVDITTKLEWLLHELSSNVLERRRFSSRHISICQHWAHLVDQRRPVVNEGCSSRLMRLKLHVRLADRVVADQSMEERRWESIWVDSNSVAVVIAYLSEHLDFELLGDNLPICLLGPSTNELEWPAPRLPSILLLRIPSHDWLSTLRLARLGLRGFGCGRSAGSSGSLAPIWLGGQCRWHRPESGCRFCSIHDLRQRWRQLPLHCLRPLSRLLLAHEVHMLYDRLCAHVSPHICLYTLHMTKLLPPLLYFNHLVDVWPLLCDNFLHLPLHIVVHLFGGFHMVRL